MPHDIAAAAVNVHC